MIVLLMVFNSYRKERVEMKSMPWFIVVCVVTLFGHAHIYTSNQTKMLKENVKLTEQARQIEHDEVRDLMFALQEERGKNEVVAAQSFVAGVVDTLNRPDHYQEIWHSGYDRGTEVQKYADSAKPEATTQLGF